MKQGQQCLPLHRTAAVLFAAMALALIGLGSGACGGDGSVTVGRYGDFEVRVPAGWRIGLGPEDIEDVDPELLPVMMAGPRNVRDGGILVFRHDGASLAEAEESWRTQLESATFGPSRSSERGDQRQLLLEGTRVDPGTGKTRHVLLAVAGLRDHPGDSWVVFCDAAREAFLRDCRQFVAGFTVTAAE
ncbi:MAG: hypothetical protein IH609_18820 [Dehalococcoidia bacterium]|nr:hypothetical protein [Dehalococcoidia bacterium]